MKRILLPLIPVVLLAQGTVSVTDKLNREAAELAKDGKYEKAIDGFEKAVALEDAVSARTYNNIGFTYELAGDRLKAMAAYQKAVDRNPRLIPSLANLGKLQFLTGQYTESIKNGERVMQLDPRNKDVPKWLPEAYRKAAEERMYALQQEQENPDADKDQKDDKKKEKPVYVEVRTLVSAPLLYSKSDKQFSLAEIPGFTEVPANLGCSYFPSYEFSVHFDYSTPFLGMGMPQLVKSRQDFEMRFHGDKYQIGLVVLATQADLGAQLPGLQTGFIENTGFAQVNDTKFGISWQFENNYGTSKFVVVPRYLIKDPANAVRGAALDANRLSFEFRTRPGSGKAAEGMPAKTPTSLFLGFHLDELFVREYDIPSSDVTLDHYFGTFDLKIGLEFGKAERKFDSTSVSFGFYFRERLYFRDLNETAITKFSNGQGFFGYDAKSALNGKFFPGFLANSHTLALFSRQFIGTRLLLGQEVSFEYTGSNRIPTHNLLVNFSAAVQF